MINDNLRLNLFSQQKHFSDFRMLCIIPLDFGINLLVLVKNESFHLKLINLVPVETFKMSRILPIIIFSTVLLAVDKLT